MLSLHFEHEKKSTKSRNVKGNFDKNNDCCWALRSTIKIQNSDVNIIGEVKLIQIEINKYNYFKWAFTSLLSDVTRKLKNKLRAFENIILCEQVLTKLIFK